jgi:hypothetical protein
MSRSQKAPEFEACCGNLTAKPITAMGSVLVPCDSSISHKCRIDSEKASVQGCCEQKLQLSKVQIRMQLRACTTLPVHAGQSGEFLIVPHCRSFQSPTLPAEKRKQCSAGKSSIPFSMNLNAPSGVLVNSPVHTIYRADRSLCNQRRTSPE